MQLTNMTYETDKKRSTTNYCNTEYYQYIYRVHFAFCLCSNFRTKTVSIRLYASGSSIQKVSDPFCMNLHDITHIKVLAFIRCIFIE